MCAAWSLCKVHCKFAKSIASLGGWDLVSEGNGARLESVARLLEVQHQCKPSDDEFLHPASSPR